MDPPKTRWVAASRAWRARGETEDSPATVARVSTAPEPAGPANSRLRILLESTWVVGVLAYGLARTFVVWSALGDYGVNPWIYGAIDLISSVPYAIGTARVVTGCLDRDWARVRRWGLIAAVAFIAPNLRAASTASTCASA